MSICLQQLVDFLVNWREKSRRKYDGSYETIRHIFRWFSISSNITEVVNKYHLQIINLFQNAFDRSAQLCNGMRVPGY
jgi:hypothetical protein